MKHLDNLFFALITLTITCFSACAATTNDTVMVDANDNGLRTTNFFRSNLIAGSGVTFSYDGQGRATIAAPGSGQPASANLTNWSNVGTNQVVFVTDFQTYTNGIGAAYQPADAQLTNLALLSYSGNASKYIRVNAGETGFELATVSGGGSSLTNTFNGNQFTLVGGTNVNISSGVTLTNIASYQGLTLYGGGLPWQILNGDTQGDGLYFYYNGSGDALFHLGSSSIGPSNVGYQYNLGSSSLPFSKLFVTNGNFYGGITNDTLTASRLVYSDANKKLSSVTITAPMQLSGGTLSTPNFVGDSGSGGTAGLVPAPGAGDSGKYLKGDGTWGVVSGSGTLTSVTNAGNASFSLINSSNAPVPAFKSLSAGSNVTLTDQGTNIVVAATGGASSWPVTNSGVTIKEWFSIYNLKTNANAALAQSTNLPTTSDGTAFWTNNITTIGTNTLLVVEANFQAGASVGNSVWVAAFIGTNMIGGGYAGIINATAMSPLYVVGTYTNSTPQAIEIVYRFGPVSAGTAYINRQNTIADLWGFPEKRLNSASTIKEMNQ